MSNVTSAAIILWWIHTGLVADGFNVHVSTNGESYIVLANAGLPDKRPVDGAYSFAINPLQVEGVLGTADHAWFKVSAYKAGETDSSPSNARHKHPWGADINKSGSVNWLDWNVFTGCFYQTIKSEECSRCDYNDDTEVNVVDHGLFAQFWEASQ